MSTRVIACRDKGPALTAIGLVATEVSRLYTSQTQATATLADFDDSHARHRCSCKLPGPIYQPVCMPPGSAGTGIGTTDLSRLDCNCRP
eukprot:scaffold28851_cov37-Prasinocladus_malaysianus.AAC.2